MNVKTRTNSRLVLTTNRRWVALANLVGAPVVIWLGLKIVEEGDAAWFGWCFAGLGAVMVLLGIWALFLRISLVLDRDHDLIRFSLRGLTRRRNKMMALSDLERVQMGTIQFRWQVIDTLEFVARGGSGQEDLRIAEFWTKQAALDAHFEIAQWLQETAPG